MFIHIPSTTYSATVEGSVVKDVTCENCGEVYSYTMSRLVNGFHKVPFSSSRGPEKALKNARANLAKALETEHDNVPCPACKWHQPLHIAYVRSQLYPQLKNLAGAFFIFAGFAVAFILVILALGMLVVREVPNVSSILQFALILVVMPLAIASPGLLLRGFRSLLALNYRPNG
jgi:hypothetical protein